MKKKKRWRRCDRIWVVFFFLLSFLFSPGFSSSSCFQSSLFTFTIMLSVSVYAPFSSIYLFVFIYLSPAPTSVLLPPSHRHHSLFMKFSLIIRDAVIPGDKLDREIIQISSPSIRHCPKYDHCFVKVTHSR